MSQWCRSHLSADTAGCRREPSTSTQAGHADVTKASIAKKKGLIISGGPKYIYTGSGHGCISCKFINYSDQDVELKSGDKIAQVVFIKYPSWILGDFDATCSLENADVSVLPDPLDETFMSPMFDNNLESIVAWHSSNESVIPLIDQTDKVSYFFQSPKDVILESGKVTCIMTGIRCKIGPGQVFILKCDVANPCVELANSIGVIDADYYDNPDNGGEIGVLLLNRGNVPVQVHTGDVIASGSIFLYEKADGDVYGGKRVGGFGSTDRK